MMLDPKKKVKKYAAAVLLLLILAVSVSGLHIQSVKHYKEEQNRLAQDIIVADAATGAAAVAEQEKDAGDMAETETSPNPLVVQPEPSITQSEEKRIGTAKDPETSYSSGKTGEKDRKASTDQGEGKDKRDSAGSDSSSKRTAASSGQKHSDTARPQTAPPKNKNPQQTPVVPAKEEQKPSPTSKEEQKSFVCSITIRCDSMFQHLDAVDEAVKEYLPADGILLGQTSVKVEQGDTAYSLLQKACQAKDIALDASQTNMYSSAYVRGIGHIYEKQAGLSSGWLYLVNGKLPGYGASRYRLKEGDQIEWVYSCTGKLE